MQSLNGKKKKRLSKIEPSLCQHNTASKRINKTISSMKRRLIILSFIMCEMLCYGQHVNFLGIPLGGDISTFKHKLIEKGYDYSPQHSNVGGYVGADVFFGRFSGEFAIIAVHYTPHTKLVARVEVQYSGYSQWPYKTNARKFQEEIFEDR